MTSCTQKDPKDPSEQWLFFNRTQWWGVSPAAVDAPVLKLDSATVFLPTLGFSRQDDTPMGVLILAGTTHFLTFKVFLFSFPCKGRGGEKETNK